MTTQIFNPELVELLRSIFPGRDEIVFTANVVLRDGTATLTADWDIGDTRAIKADKVRARDGDGLALQDDGGNGMAVADGGTVTFRKVTGAGFDEVARFTISDASTDYLRVINTTSATAKMSPAFEGHCETSNLPAVLAIGSTPSGADTGTTAVIQFRAVQGASDSASAVTSRDLFRLANNTTAVFEVDVNGIFEFLATMGNSSKDPTTDAPSDWVEIKIGGTTYYLPAYAA